MVTSCWNTSTSLLHLHKQVPAQFAVSQMWLAALSTLIWSVLIMQIFKVHHRVRNFHHSMINLMHSFLKLLLRMLKLDRSYLFYNLIKPFLVFHRRTWTHRSHFVILKPTVERYNNNNINNNKGKFYQNTSSNFIHFNALTNYFIHFNTPAFKLSILLKGKES